MAKVLLHLDPDGSLRVPAAILRAAGLGNRVELDVSRGALSLRPAESAAAEDPTEDDIVEICRGIRRELHEETHGHPSQ